MPNRTVLLLALAAFCTPALAQDTLVVTTDDLRPGLADWIAFRESQGRRVRVAAPGADVAAVVRAAAGKEGARLTHVLLLGDVDRVPCAYREAVAMRASSSQAAIATASR